MAYICQIYHLFPKPDEKYYLYRKIVTIVEQI